MTPSHSRKIQSLYRAAVDLAPAEQAQLLARIEPGLRREVASLLADRNHTQTLEYTAPRSAAAPGCAHQDFPPDDLPATMSMRSPAQFAGPFHVGMLVAGRFRVEREI